MQQNVYQKKGGKEKRRSGEGKNSKKLTGGG